MKKKHHARKRKESKGAPRYPFLDLSFCARVAGVGVCVCVCVWGGWIFELVGVLFVTEGPDQRFFLRRKKICLFYNFNNKNRKGGDSSFDTSSKLFRALINKERALFFLSFFLSFCQRGGFLTEERARNPKKKEERERD